MEFADILTALDPQLPCGEDLEYDLEFLQLQQAAVERSEQQFGSTIIPAQPPDWREVERLARGLLERTRDIRVMAYLTQAWTEVRGLQGYAQGVTLVADTLERYWEAVHPRLDSDGDYDPMPRMNALSSLGAHAGCAPSVRSSRLVNGVHGQLTLRDAESLLDGSRADPEFYPGGRARLVEHLRQAWMQQDSALVAIAAADEGLRRIQRLVADKLGRDWVPDYTAMYRTLNVVLQALGDSVAQPAPAPPSTETIPSASEVNVMDSQHSHTGNVAAQPVMRWQDAQIQSREEASAMLAKVCAYFEVHEPSHPAPYLIRRAQQLISMSFHDIIKNLAPQGLEQFETWLPKDADGASGN
ncbi:type VI secretion system protein TssA [Bordetella sp. 15P40C-2]|uniref:type VI secretion system protein TssA n=1 Tax=Bordetella sp. 15P40C-2 TaxID=2572246 RepID=UPI0013239CA1|nr:type VI secretion system protein TssA [Bordetella sp. 15P40C-2]MVW70272.1 type VI secretion system protein TssA [Bordetella sp. 15P40C-2]